jgi:CubicO group peptidase (beta-lactamase class C family)
MKPHTPIAALFVAVLLAGPRPTPADTSGSPDELAGLWKAARWYGPFARGPLVIRRTGTTYTADMVGQLLPVNSDARELSFELPGGEGSFRGRLQSGGDILGHWYPPKTRGMGFRYASPVWLKAEGANRWSGQVRPYDDVFSFYLLAKQRPDGSLGVILRNHERDYGGWLAADRLERDGKVVKLIGKRQGQEQVAAIGGYDAENEVLTLAFPYRGGTYDFRRDDDTSAFYPRGKNPARYTYRPPLARDDGWPTGTLDEANIDRAGIERLVQLLIDAPMESAETPKVHALLIARHGKLVLEEYFHGEHRDKLHETRSAAKSVTAVLVGAAMHAGAPLELSTPVYEIMNGGTFPPDLEPRKRAMTLEHLLTMSSGYYCDDNDEKAPGNEENMLDQTDEPDYYHYTLRVPMATTPGEKAVYCSANPNLALGVMSRATGESPLDTFDRLVGRPMKIMHYAWDLDPAGHAYGGGGVQFLPRDFLKFGQLMLNGGTWQGRRILSREFAARASAPLYHLGGIYYGYLWWSVDYPYKDRTVRAFFAGGAGGQSVIVIPELDLVIAGFGANYSSPGTVYVQRNITPRYLLPAVREAGDDKKAPVVPREDFAPKMGSKTETGPVTQPR